MNSLLYTKRLPYTRITGYFMWACLLLTCTYYNFLFQVQPPDVLTRISEYVPEVVAYCEKIIENKYA